MSAVELIALAASLSLLAGWRIYLVTFATGIAMKFGWVDLPEQLAALDVLADNWVIGIAAGRVVLTGGSQPGPDGTVDVLVFGAQRELPAIGRDRESGLRRFRLKICPTETHASRKHDRRYRLLKPIR